jgi:hypothetical protein
MKILRPATGMLTIALVLSPACSFIFSRGPSPGRTSCSRSYVPPIIDTLTALPMGALFLLGAANEKDSNNAPVPEDEIIGASLVITLIYSLSALHGYNAVSGCRATR